MDTPDKKNQFSPSFLSKFEDSPVFSYISNLSPIKSFSLNHSSQSIPLLGFASPQSLQTPPPVNCPKESNIRSVSNVSDASKNNCSQNGSECTISEMSGAAQPADLSIKEKGKFASGREETVRATDESNNLVNDLPISAKYEPASPDSDLGRCDAVMLDCQLNVAGKDIIPLKIIQDVCKETDNSLENEMSSQEIAVEHSGNICDWEKFIVDASMETHQDELPDKNVDSGTLSFVTEVLQAPNEIIDDTQKKDSLISTVNPEEVGEQNGASQVPAVIAQAITAEQVTHQARTDADDKSSSQQEQTTLRRCLVYEMSGSHYRKILSDPGGGSPISLSAANSDTSNEKCLAPNKPGNSKFSSPFPGIGLHLNALAAGGREKIIVKRQNLTCRRQLISSPCIISSFDPLTSKLKISNPPVIPKIEERSPEEQINYTQVNETVQKDYTQVNETMHNDSTQVNETKCEKSVVGVDVDLPQSSPKKKRTKPDGGGGMNSCKRCNCKRSKCLKLYCECFAAGLYCVEPCNCQECFNKPAHEDIVLETRRQIESRNPLAFAPKVISFSGTPSSAEELNKTPASARHKRGCNCKKSGCLKKYCECFQGGVGCSLSCRCEGCKNTFGHKEGIEGIVFKKAKILKICASEVSSHDEDSKIEDQGQATPEPSDATRQLVRRPFPFSSMEPQFHLLPAGQPLQTCTNPKNENMNHTALEETQKTAPEDDAAEVLRGDYLFPTTSVKSTSPNSKRISSHYDFESSAGWKSCRKLILRSIPACSTVTSEKEGTELQGKLQ